MCFAYCDLWWEAALRWMTLLFTARSRAEMYAIAAARVFSASEPAAAALAALARDFKRVLIAWLREALRADLRVALIADFVLAMG